MSMENMKDRKPSGFLSAFFAVVITVFVITLMRLFVAGDLMDAGSINKETLYAVGVVNAFALFMPLMLLLCISAMVWFFGLNKKIENNISAALIFYFLLCGLLFYFGFTSSRYLYFNIVKISQGVIAVLTFALSFFCIKRFIEARLPGSLAMLLPGLCFIAWGGVTAFLIYNKNVDFLNKPFPAAFQVTQDTAPNIIVIGADGLDWGRTNVLRSKGLLPNIDRLMETGSCAPLHTLKPTSSPFIWNTIYTGYMPGIHQLRPSVIALPYGVMYKRNHTGMPDFFQLGAELLLPQNRTINHYPLSFWEILMRAGYHAAVIGTWEKSPLSRKGMVNFINCGYSPFDMGKITIEDQYFDEELTEYIDAINIPQDQIPAAEWNYFNISRTAQEDFFKPLIIPNNPDPSVMRLCFLRASYATDRFRYLLGKKVLENIEQPFCMFLYFKGIDMVSHCFLTQFDEGVANSDAEKDLMDAVPQYYRKIDEWIGDIVSAMPSHTVVMIVSDHGFDPSRFRFEHTFYTNNHDFAPDGVFIVNGPDMPPERLERVHVLDVTPSILSLAGLPELADMAGKSVFIKTTESLLVYDYVQFKKQAFTRGDPRFKDIEIDEKLKALGYVD